MHLSSSSLDEGLHSGIPNHLLQLAPPFQLHNQLPATLQLEHPSLGHQPLVLDPGAHTNLYKVGGGARGK